MTELEVIGSICIAEDDVYRLARLICETEDPAHDYLICLKTVDSAEMQHLNRVYRGINKTTDVLSFVSEELLVSNVDEPAVSRHLKMCDIIIDINQLIQQKDNKTLEEEFRIVLIHGLLHLVGYDHIRKHDACEMETKEHYYLKTIQGE